MRFRHSDCGVRNNTARLNSVFINCFYNRYYTFVSKYTVNSNLGGEDGFTYYENVKPGE